MSDPIQLICELANCSKEAAEASYNETKDVVESVDRLLAKSPSNGVKIPTVTRTREQRDPLLQKSEDVMRHMARKLHPTITSKDPLVSMIDSGKKPLPVQKAPQNNYVQECLIPFLGSRG
jgi:hypothetical protein